MNFFSFRVQDSSKEATLLFRRIRRLLAAKEKEKHCCKKKTRFSPCRRYMWLQYCIFVILLIFVFYLPRLYNNTFHPENSKSKIKSGGSDGQSTGEYESIFFGCPGCSTKLPARRWRDPNKATVSRVEVLSPTG